MVTAAAGEVWRVYIQGHIEGQECENVLAFRTPLGDSDVLAHLIADLVECFVTGLVPVLSASYTFDQIVAKRITPTIGPDVIFLPSGAMETQGQAAGDSEPSFVSALISLRTSFGGRSGRGRMFIAGVSEGNTTGSRIPSESALWLALLAFVTCMLSKFLTPDPPVVNKWEWGVFSTKIGGTKAPFSATGFHPMIAAAPSPYLATTRSRMIGHGR
jgi:hypothetical protein